MPRQSTRMLPRYTSMYSIQKQYILVFALKELPNSTSKYVPLTLTYTVLLCCRWASPEVRLWSQENLHPISLVCNTPGM